MKQRTNSLALPEIDPVYPNVLILPDEVKKPEGVLLPDTIHLEPNRGIVLRSSVDHFQPGHHVQWKELAGTYVDELLLVPADDILPMLITDEEPSSLPYDDAD